ncbi:prolyl oligopeptidase family serine peptidase [Nitratireductor sp. CAU 1489]|uniref:Prolyl oligopeptidase family serine peptidase n=1 Tax=Nitratireductor arenosus TaxID=2682096 RepID=A0A844QIE4_9HYPH|nr:dienelactone hydrolase family protein [Nitratireductor arenosus]MVA97711.1 prolyl oligopeptidase family serine peptidase [Nitratireductor arenosus]
MSRPARLTSFFILVVVLALGAATPPAAATSERIAGDGWAMTVHYPAGDGPFPAVIVMPGCGGNSPPAVARGLRAHARALNAAGFAAAIIDVLSPRGLDTICARAALLARLTKAVPADIADAAARLGRLRRVDARRLAFLGQSFGGSVALEMAAGAGGRFAAIVAYYPWCADGYGRAGMSRFTTPVLILTGLDDDWTPAERCTRLRPASGSYPARIVAYRGAHHSFDLPGLPRQKVPGVGGAKTVGGNPAAGADSRRRYLAFLKERLEDRR